MLRLTAIFIAICVVLIAVSLGAIGYLIFGLSGAEATLVALGIMTALALYNTVTTRLRERSDLDEQITDLSRGTADLARQVAEFGRRVIAMEQKETSQRPRGAGDQMAAEIGELGVLVKQLAETVASHDAALAELHSELRSARALHLVQAETIPVALAEPARPVLVVPEPEPQAALDIVTSGPLRGKSAEEIAALVRQAIEEDRIDMYLQPVVTLPQRKVRYYEAVTRLRLDDGTLVLPADFFGVAEKAGLLPRIDNIQMFRCVQVLRRLQLKNREVGVFCNVSAQTLNDAETFRQFFDFLDANRALASSLTLEFPQPALQTLGPIEQESLAALIALGFRVSMDHVTDLRMGPRDLAEMGVRFVKVPAATLLNKNASPSDIHAADLSDLLGRHGISLIAERIETEAAVVDLLDFDVRFGQGFLFSPPRPVRAEALQGASARPDAAAGSGELRAAI